ncbi:MAG: hypothetical protein HY917_04920 [Candidatus Diapherotrites archaeon]|nr:hypothetical protein [Candidatus Diapherotrites archaeon]
MSFSSRFFIIVIFFLPLLMLASGCINAVPDAPSPVDHVEFKLYSGFVPMDYPSVRTLRVDFSANTLVLVNEYVPASGKESETFSRPFSGNELDSLRVLLSNIAPGTFSDRYEFTGGSVADAGKAQLILDGPAIFPQRIEIDPFIDVRELSGKNTEKLAVLVDELMKWMTFMEEQNASTDFSVRLKWDSVFGALSDPARYPAGRVLELDSSGALTLTLEYLPDSNKSADIISTVLSARDLTTLRSLTDSLPLAQLKERYEVKKEERPTDTGPTELLLQRGSLSKSVILDAGADVPELKALLAELYRLTNWAESTYSNASTAWFFFEPVACGNNSWEQWHADLNRVYVRAPTEEEILKEYFQTVQGIGILDFSQVESDRLVCRSCDCPRGDYLTVRVNAKDSSRMQELGWKPVGPVEFSLVAQRAFSGETLTGFEFEVVHSFSELEDFLSPWLPPEKPNNEEPFLYTFVPRQLDFESKTVIVLVDAASTKGGMISFEVVRVESDSDSLNVFLKRINREVPGSEAQTGTPFMPVYSVAILQAEKTDLPVEVFWIS